VDRVHPDFFGEIDDAGDIEIRADRFARLTDAIGLVRLETVKRETILMGIDRDRANAEFVG
jgi:hypothetical protein